VEEVTEDEVKEEKRQMSQNNLAMGPRGIAGER
jgi:hypothetical protein